MRRLDQLLANLGYCSRRAARDFLRTHGVSDRNGARLLDPSKKVEASAVLVDDAPLDHPDGLLILMHKPLGRICSHDSSGGPSIYDLLPPRWRERTPQVTSIGRLDKETTGVLLLTDQSALVHRLTSPRHHVPKRYLVTVDRDLPPNLDVIFSAGTLLLEGEKDPCEPAIYETRGPREAAVTLTQGRYHQVRRMFAAAAGVTVTSLHRESFGDLTLGGLALGQWLVLPLETLGPPVP